MWLLYTGTIDLLNRSTDRALTLITSASASAAAGIHDDATVNDLRGHGLPILNLYERALSLLSCKVGCGACFTLCYDCLA